MKQERMYEVEGKRVPTWNPLVGCEHNCSYCYARDIVKRQKHRCLKCYDFVLHFHQERLKRKFKAGETVFVCSMGDIAFASDEELYAIMQHIKKFPNTTFLMQTKNPVCLHNMEEGFLKFQETLFSVPGNIFFGTTIETNRGTIIFSDAPDTQTRYKDMKFRQARYSQYITIEPIMDFDLDVMVRWAKEIKPIFVYIGYNSRDSKNKHLPEPSLEKTERLIRELEKITEVRRKLIRKAWWEKE